MPAKKPRHPQPPALKNVRNCQHIKVTGIQCGGPAMRGEQFCYFHQRLLRGVKTPPNVRIHPIALIEDEESIQASLMEVINALARNHIDLRRADLILKALYIAVRNSRRARFNVSHNHMVREIPDYPAPAKPAPVATEVPEKKELPKFVVQNALAQLQASALAALPLRESSPTSAGEKVPRASSELVEGWDLATNENEPLTTASPNASAQTLLTMKNSDTIQPPKEADPTRRKPPARAGAPAITKIAVNQSQR